MDTSILDSPVQPPAHWGTTDFVSVKELKKLHTAALEADENVSTIMADIEAIKAEVTELESRGNREGLTRLIELETKRTALERLLPAAEDSAEAAHKRLYAALWSAWHQLHGRASTLRQALIEERIQKLRDHPVVKSTSMSRDDVNWAVGSMAESWPPLSRLHIDVSVDWKRPLSDYLEAEKRISALEKNPTAIEDE